ncbi:hypothetical protein DJ031_00040 [bacterium endosymbiont of Escarpia laminata]|nr:MAG: hypothetical protein DJ031_00040 [bacterium endosymbiont of Escarpia laminata]
MEMASIVDRRSPPKDTNPRWDMVTPITTTEVVRHLKGMKDGAPGPDLRRKKDLTNLRVEALVCRFNIWLLAGIAPESFRHGVTVLIPKVENSVEPKQFRPITMGPILCRLYHKILAERIESGYTISERQKAFRRGDGLSDNTHILRNVISNRQTRCQATAVAFLDVSKAFDSVSHDSILLAATSAGIPRPLVGYIRSLYQRPTTRLRVNGELSQEISVNRGVRQGDPLSPVLFNAVIDLALRHLDPSIGVPVGNEVLSCLAFADDLVLLAKTPRGLQSQYSKVEKALGLSGLALNAQKSATIRIDVLGKSKQWSCNPTDFLVSRGGDLIKALSISEGYRYLGNLVGAGRLASTTLESVKKGVEELSRAPLKPEQRMFILRCHLLPSLLHRAVLGRLSRSTLDFIDKISRAAARSWVKLPHDTPMGFFHASHKDGGLGIPRFRWLIPILRTKRMERMIGSSDPVVRAVTELKNFQRDLRRWSKPISAFGIILRNNRDIQRASAECLYSSVDGHGLRGSRNEGFVNGWMTSGTGLVSGRSYVNCVKIKGNLIHTALRASRGRPEASTRCDACRGVESLGHILQVCPRTHHTRCDRHDGINSYLKTVLGKKGYTTRVEPSIPTPAGIRRPDLVVWKDDKCGVIDVTIIADNHSLEDAHQRKTTYYNQPAIREWCAKEFGLVAADVAFTACVINWRGTPAARSVLELGRYGVTRKEWALMSVKTLEGNARIIASFRSSTAYFGPRL